ncbi:MAG: DUF3311 domain-containing protein [Nocardioides sp.]
MAAPNEGPEGSPTPPKRSDRSRWNWLLVVPLLAVLYPPLYNRATPELAGVPFFYWYQLAAVVIGVACTLVVYVKTRG